MMGMVRGLSANPTITLFGHTATPAFWFNLSACCLFVGAMGKSAQIPLYVWLPDAMAGPTPVSALIHAATMVTSGLYMITRLNFIYVQAPVALSLVLLVGSLTALFAATMGLAQYDIKKVLAYSTVSQLGFMFMARRGFGRHVPRLHPRGLRLAYSWRGFRHRRLPSRAGHAQHGWVAQGHAVDLASMGLATLAIARPPSRFFQGRDPVEGLRTRMERPGFVLLHMLGHGHVGGLLHGLLHGAAHAMTLWRVRRRE